MADLTIRTLWNVGSNYTRTLVLVVVSLLLNPFLFHQLGDEGYGVIALTGTTAGLLGMLDLGLAHAVARFVSRYHTLNEPQRVNQAIQTAVCTYLIVGLLAAIVVGTVGIFFVGFLGVPPSYRTEAQWLFILAGLSLAIRFPGNALDGALRGLQRFALSNAAQIADRVTYAILVVSVLVLLNLGIVAIGICMIAGSVMAVSVRFVGLMRAYQQLSVGLGCASWTGFLEMAGFGSMAFLTQVSSFFDQTVLRLIISATLSSTLLGAYSLVMVIVSVLPQLTIGATSVVMPLASRFEAHNDHSRLQRLLMDGSRLVFFIITPAAIWIIVMADAITRTWVGPELEPWSGLLRIMTLVTAVDLCCGAGNMVLMGTGRARLLGVTYLVSSLVAMLVLVVLLQMTLLGLYAAAVALGVGVLVRRSIVLVRMCRCVDIPVSDYVLRVLSPTVLCGLVTAGVLVVTRRLGLSDGWGALAGSVGVAVAAHVAISLILVIRREERKMVLSRLGRLFQAGAAAHR